MILGAYGAQSRRGDQALGVLEYLRVGRASGCRFLLRGFTLLILQFSLVEAHARIVIE